MSGPAFTVALVDDPVVILTVVLAVLNAILAWSTHRTAQSADRQVEVSRVQLERAHRPVLVPFQQQPTDGVRFRGGTVEPTGGPQISENPAHREDLPRWSAAFLAVENVGMGPALNVRGRYTGPRGSGEVRFPTEGVGAGARAVVSFETWTGESLAYTGNDSEVSAVVEYDDVAGQTYRTRVTFDIGSNAYRSELEAEGTPSRAG